VERRRISYLWGILIAGSSHVGKSTLAEKLAHELDRRPIATDNLARHPGRLWPKVRDPVAEYFTHLSSDTIHWFLKVHHENTWPLLRQIIDAHLKARDPFIMEGSALRPEYIASLDRKSFATIFLFANGDLLRERMRDAAHYDDANEVTRSIIDKFIERSLRDNSEMRASATRLGIQVLNVAAPEATQLVFDAFAPSHWKS
jgi:2-phosphoglycerate kinase